MWPLKSVVLAVALVVSVHAELTEYWETEYTGTTGSPSSWSYQSGGSSGQAYTWTEIVTETIVQNGGSHWSSSSGSGGSGSPGGGMRWSSSSGGMSTGGGGGGYMVKKKVPHAEGGAVRRAGGGSMVQGSMAMAPAGGQKRIAGYQMVPATSMGMTSSIGGIGGTSMLTRGSPGFGTVGMTSAVSSGRSSGGVLPVSAIGK